MSDQSRLSFHVPAPAVRPGGTADFSDVNILPAGEVRRPEVIRDMAYSNIRVLNRDGEAVGPWVGQLLQPRSGLLAIERLRFSLPCATA